MEAIISSGMAQLVSKQEKHTEKKDICCPVCGTKKALKETRGMILCTTCCWAMELPNQKDS